MNCARENYRAYENTRELIVDYKNMMKSHGKDIFDPSFFYPVIWIKNFYGTRYMVLGLSDDCVILKGGPRSMKELFRDYMFLDGTPCGKFERAF